MASIYVAVNGDDVGHRIGQAIASDDHEGLSSASDSIKQSHDMISQWAEQSGGKVVTSSGDEGIYLVPEEALNDLEQIKSDYSEMSGHDLTVGVGSSMSEASKALIYGKLNGKNQIVQYEPSIDDAISGEDEGEEPSEEIPSGEELDDSVYEDEEAEAGIEPEDSMEDKPEFPEDEGFEEEGIAPEDQDGNIPVDLEDDQAEDEYAEADTEAPMGEEGEMPPEMEGEQPPMEGAPPEEGMAPEMEGEGGEEESESPYQDLAPETEADQEGEEDDYDHNDALTDMIQGQMEGGGEDPSMEGEQPPMEGEGEEMPMGEEEMEDPSMQEEGMAPEEGMDEEMPDDGMATDEEVGPDDSLDAELKEDISAALMAFKENKHILEEARASSPELYDATITMLRSMIHMAKRLGYGPEEDIAAAEGQAEAEQEFPMAEGSEDIPPEEEGGDQEEEFFARKKG